MNIKSLHQCYDECFQTCSPPSLCFFVWFVYLRVAFGGGNATASSAFLWCLLCDSCLTVSFLCFRKSSSTMSALFCHLTSFWIFCWTSLRISMEQQDKVCPEREEGLSLCRFIHCIALVLPNVVFMAAKCSVMELELHQQLPSVLVCLRLFLLSNAH